MADIRDLEKRLTRFYHADHIGSVRRLTREDGTITDGYTYSAFGELGLTQELSQKRFETLVWDAFRRLPAGFPIIVEGESKRIGKVTLPGDLYEVMQASVKVWCEASLETRVARLTAEYGLPAYRDGMVQALERIRKRLGGETYAAIAGHLERWEMEPFMADLVRHYYDKVYYKTREWQQDLTLSMEDYAAAEAQLTAFLRHRFGATFVPVPTAPLR